MRHFTSALAQWNLWIAWIALSALAACGGSSTLNPHATLPAGGPATNACGSLCVVPSQIHFESPKSSARMIKVRDWNGKINRVYGCKSKRIVTFTIVHLHFYGWSYVRVKPDGANGQCLFPLYGHYEGRVFFHAIVGK